MTHAQTVKTKANKLFGFMKMGKTTSTASKASIAKSAEIAKSDKSLTPSQDTRKSEASFQIIHNK